MAAMTAMEITTIPPTTPPMIGANGIFFLDTDAGMGGDGGVGDGVDEDEDEDDDSDSELVGVASVEKLMLDRLVMDVSMTEPPLVKVPAT
jgi:hypothetical protein